MSYILDALKRADAERERGSVPGLHARQVVPQASHAARDARSRLWPAIAAVFILCVVAGLWVWRSTATDTPVVATGPAVPAPVAPAPLAQPAPMPHPLTDPAPNVPPAAAQSRAVASAPATMTRAMPAPAAAPVVAPAVATTIARATGSAPTPAPAAETATSPVPKPAEPGTAVPFLGELAEGIRRQIPQLSITGLVYSEIPGQRMLIVNNQVLMQGTLAAPEVQLEEIRARSAVFSFRGTRFQVAH